MKVIKMKKLQKIRLTKNQKGFALFITVLFMLMLAVIVVPFFNVIVLNLLISGNQEKRVSAFYLADAGVQYAQNQLSASDGEWSGTTAPYYLIHSTETVGSFTVDVNSTINSYGYLIYKVNSIGQMMNSFSRASIQVMLRKGGYGDYLFLMDKTTGIYFGSEDIVKGKVHANDYINVTGTPVFQKLVTTTQTVSTTKGSRPIFQDGVLTKVSPISLPDVNDFVTLKNLAQNGGLYIQPSGDVTIDINTTYMTVTYKSGSKTTTYNYYFNSTTSNKMIYVNDHDIYLSGTLNGQVTIVSNNGMYITDNLVYLDESANSDDILGLISKKDIVLLDSIAPDNTRIDAQIMSTNGSFKGEIARRRSNLTVYGSIAQKQLGAFRNSNSTRGYTNSQHWEYDNRLKFVQPPNYLKAGNTSFQMIYWKNAYFQ